MAEGDDFQIDDINDDAWQKLLGRLDGLRLFAEEFAFALLEQRADADILLGRIGGRAQTAALRPDSRGRTPDTRRRLEAEDAIKSIVNGLIISLQGGPLDPKSPSRPRRR